MTLEQLVEVWTPLSIAASIVSGLAFGYAIVGAFASDPVYASGEATPIAYARLVAALVGAVGMLFYSLQILTSYWAGDTAWTRVVSRFGLWVLYAAAIGLGTWIRLHRHIARKHAEAHGRAVHELEADR